jgi:hypothetical protein
VVWIISAAKEATTWAEASFPSKILLLHPFYITHQKIARMTKFLLLPLFEPELEINVTQSDGERASLKAS